MRLLFPFLVLAASLPLPAQVPATTPGPSGGPASSSGMTAQAMATYHSDTLHLTYNYPSSYKDASSTVGPALEASMTGQDTGAKDVLRCVTLPFSAMDSSGGQFAMVLLVRADAACMKRNLTPAQLPEFTRGEVQGLTASGAHTQFGEPVSFTLQGHAAQLLQGTFELPTSQPMHALVVCTLLKPDIACWQFLSNSEQNLRTMTSFPVTLEGGQPSPLVPADLLSKP